MKTSFLKQLSRGLLATALSAIALGLLAWWGAPSRVMLAGDAPDTLSVQSASPASAQGTAIRLTKTVGLEPGECAATPAITVAPHSQVVYCYHIANTGDVTFTTHTVTDDKLGIIAAGLAYTLTPGQSFFITATATLTQTTSNTAMWQAYNAGSAQLTFAFDSAHVTVVPPAISLDKTVGTDPRVCAASDSIIVPAGAEVAYCYTVRNTGLHTLTTHSLVDNELGDILTNHLLSLPPGGSAFVTKTAVISATTINTATWTALDALGNAAAAADTAAVTVYTSLPLVQIRSPYRDEIITQRGTLNISGVAWNDDTQPGFPGDVALSFTRLAPREYYLVWTPSVSATDYIIHEASQPDFASYESLDRKGVG